MNRLLCSIRYRRKKYLLIAVMIFFSFILVLSTIYLLTNTKNDIYHYYQQKYGKFHVVCLNLTDDHIKKLEHESSFLKGYYSNYGAFTTNCDASLTLGSYDDTAKDLACFQFESGRWPETEQEIVIDSISSRYAFGNRVSVGEKITLKDTYGHHYSFTICGILKDFRGIWNQFEGIMVPGYNDYPNAIINDNDLFDQTNSSCFMYSKKDGIDGNGIISCYSYCINEVYRDYTNDMIFNNNLYLYVQNNIFSFFIQFQTTIIIITAVSVISILGILISVLLDDYTGSLRKYRQIGASQLYVTFQINMEFLLIYI